MLTDNYVKGIYRANDGKLRSAIEFFISGDEVGAKMALSKLRFHLAAFEDAEFSVWRAVPRIRALSRLPQIMGLYAQETE